MSRAVAIQLINRLLKRQQALYRWVVSNNALNRIGNDRGLTGSAIGQLCYA